ncbi:SMI1/KNR4 family protein [Flavobacterium daejeonense]|uniref:SMI1/KNR4 family protein n=1 Tax=Flavobacterium daejeonense TaxID=350893 RepID=UPI000551AD62|nr:SMI1/KNR4 family protein [Flavobacterium daejeonense]
MKKTIVILFFLLSFFLPVISNSGQLLAHIDKMIFLQGKVGEKTLTLKIKCYNESPVRYLDYFFDDKKTDQYMEGNFIGNTWQFISLETEKTEKNLVIREEKDGNWKGYWREGSDKKINVILYPINVNPEANYFYYSKSKELDPYDSYKVFIFQLDKIKTEKAAKNFQLEWLTEKESGISFFRVQNENKKVNCDSINKNLEQIQLAILQDYFRFNPNRSNLNIQAELLYLNEGIISFKIITSMSFKNQPEVKTQQFFTLDMQTGQSVDLESLIWFDPQNPKPAANEITQTYEYRKAIFAPKLFSILSELYPQQMQSTDCKLNEVTSWAIPNFALTKKGFLFCLSYSKDCNLMDWAIIPYEKLTPYLEKKYKLN